VAQPCGVILRNIEIITDFLGEKVDQVLAMRQYTGIAKDVVSTGDVP